MFPRSCRLSYFPRFPCLPKVQRPANLPGSTYILLEKACALLQTHENRTSYTEQLLFGKRKAGLRTHGSSQEIVSAPSSRSMASRVDLKGTVAPLVLGYALCSSLLAVINKYAITKFMYPGLLTGLQYATSAIGVWALGRLGLLYYDPFTWSTAKKFFPAAVVFYLAIFTNTNLLKHANVETFIVFRSSTPLLVAIADTMFRKQPWPSKYTFLSLLLILAGAIGYVLSDSGFSITAYSWAMAYLITITTEMVYIKHIVSSLRLSTWGCVLYNNFISLVISPLFCILTGEIHEIYDAFTKMDTILNIEVISSVALSCIFGLAISFFGFAARRAISATAFTVTGVVNKFLTVIINVLIWDKHASPSGLFYLILTLVGGIAYQQSTTKAPTVSSQVTTKEDVEPTEKDRSDSDLLQTDEESGLLSKETK